MTENRPQKKPLYTKILRLLLRILLVVFILFILLILFIRSPWGQDIIVGKATNYISKKIQTEFEIGKLYVTFSGNISLEDFYVEDTSEDTLVYSKYLEANVPFRPLLFGNEIKVDVVDWQGLKANVNRKDSIEGFNFQFIIDAFASQKDDDTLESEQYSDRSSIPKISIDNIVFSNFELTFEDEVTGIDTALDLGQFELSSEEINLQEMKFHFTEVNLDNTRLNVIQFKVSEPAEDEASSTLPWVLVDRFNLQKVTLDYQSIPDDITSEVYIEDFQFENLNAHLENQSIVLNTLKLKDSSLKLETKSPSETKDKDSIVNQNESFLWPQWEVKINTIHLENQTLELYNTGNRPHKGRFNPEALALKDINLNINAIDISKDEEFSFHLNDLRFMEESGLVLQEFQMQTKLNSEEISIEDLRIKINQSLLFADLKLSYSSWQELINSPEQSSVNLNVKRLKANVNDGFIFSPELQSNEQLQRLSIQPIEASFIANGNLKQLDITKFNLNWGVETHLKLQGHLTQLQDVENLGVDFSQIDAYTSKADLSKFISEEDLGLALPKKLNFSGEIKKQANQYSTHSQLTSDFGTILLRGDYNSKTQLDYSVNIDIQSLKLNQFLNNDELGLLDMKLTSQGQGNSIYELNTKVSSEIHRLDWRSYTFSGIKLKGKLKKGKGDVNLDYTDDNLNFSLTSQLDLDSLNSTISTKLDLQGIRTQNLELTEKDLRAKVLAQFQFEGNTNQYKLDAKFQEGLVVYDSAPYNLGDVNFSFSMDSLATKLKVSSSFLNAQLDANADFQRVFEALQHHFTHYLNTESKEENHQQEQPVKLNFNADFIDIPILSEVFMDGIQKMDTLKTSIQFDSQKHELSSTLSLPYLNYQEKVLNGLYVNVKSKPAALTFNFGFDQLFADPLDIVKTQLTGTLSESVLNLNLKAYEDDVKFFNSSVSLTFEEDNLYHIKLSPNDLIFNGSAWSVLDSNEIIYQNNKLQVSDFELSKNEQEIKISDNFGYEKDHLGLSFSNFKLSTLSSYFNPDEDLANGDLNGKIIIIEPFASKGLISDIHIKNLKVTQVPLGNLTLMAETKDNENYAIDLNLMGAGVDFKLAGNYHTDENTSEVNLNLGVHHLGLKTIEQFVGEYIYQSEGHLEGKFKISGSLDSLDYTGNLAFKDVQFNLKALNTAFKLEDERLEFSKDKMSFNNFTIKNEDKNPLRLNGVINFEEFINPVFDLAIEAKDFQLLNSTAKDNDLYYGTLVFDTSTQLRGNLESPDLTMDLTVKNTSDLTYIVPESQASIEERDGIVVFVNKENPDNILTQQDDEAVDVEISGVNLQSQINIQKQAKVQVIFNKRTNDNISLQGGGNFKFDMSRTGKMNLVGKYEVTKGSVELNFYNLVKRKFEISPSSTVTWNGNPYNANLDLRAVYHIETSVSSLMASQTAGENTVIKNRYKQQLPFLVYLDVGGELTSPDLSFNLNMPEDRQGAINGSVYGKITQINQQDDELNKQVFSLLVLNKFYPESGSDGSRGGPASLARDNLNQALTDQLNAFSDKLTSNTGINLNFDVNSYTDYQGSRAQERTDVDVTAQKKLLDDRLVIEAGSQVNVQGNTRAGETQGVLGNVSVEYLLTEDGRWKLKGFRKSEYENVIDGQVFVSGIALIFTREFNKFKVLWDKAYRESLSDDESKNNKSDD